MKKILALVSFGLPFGLLFALPSHFVSAATLDFNRDIRPILSDKCFHCHGPDSANREADLRLDREQDAKSDRGGYAAIVPGNLQASELVRRIESTDEAESMPPADSGRTLKNRERELLKQWIQAGAAWQAHWAFVPPVRGQPPTVQRKDWPRNTIDHFVLERLEQESLQPSPAADQVTLIRRLTLDLTGLPPTPEEVDRFLQDTSPEAYETVVDRLLRSSRYGEHMALMWLDAARFADTDGYQNDGPRSMWRWRDWVIDAYNANLPFDQFTVAQLAGDLLPEANLEQRIATGFNRNHRYNSEAGLVLEEFLLENAVDRVDTTSTVWMGLTMGCARCHDHKYDPFTQKEYYQLIALFDNVSESGRAVKFGNSEPWIVAPTKTQQAELTQHDRDVALAGQRLQAAQGQIIKRLQQWEKHAAEADPQTLHKPAVGDGLAEYFPLDGSDPRARAEVGQPTFHGGVVRQAATVDGQSQLVLGKSGRVLAQSRASIAFWLRPEDIRRGVVLSRQEPNTRRPGLAVELQDGKLQFSIITRWVAGVGAVRTLKPLEQGKWVHVVLTNDGSQSARGMKIYLDGQLAPSTITFNTNSNTGGVPATAELRIGGGVKGPRFRGQVDELRFYSRTLWQDEITHLAVPETIEQILAMSAPQRQPPQRDKLHAWFLAHVAPARLRKLAADDAAARAARLKFWDALPTTMVMDEMSPPRPTYLRHRGVYHQHGEQVDPGIPAVLPAMSRQLPNNRLGFARWLVSGQHPLTARVAMNRYWQKYFGTGLVKTPEDFGVQGEPPSHPQLLDWLATEFPRSGWNVKAMQKLIVMSATYRQSSKLVGERGARLRQQDPSNRLLARGPRSRLPAHVIRDQALAVSGLLVEQLGGPSVSPYQPANLWKEMSNMVYRQSKGRDLYRRSLYTLWKRTVVPPSMAILDAADRESCSVGIKRTNTPLQALTLLNETVFMESARQLGQRMLIEGQGKPVEFGFRQVTGRQPKPGESRLLQEALDEYLAQFRHHPERAQQLVQVGASPVAKELEPIALAAHTALANVLLNLDEVITRE